MTEASTVKVELDLPTDHPITGIHADAKPGWTSAVETVKLAKPITTDDGQITEVVSKVTWTTTGPGIQPNEYSTFTVLAGLLPYNVNSLTFKRHYRPTATARSSLGSNPPSREHQPPSTRHQS